MRIPIVILTVRGDNGDIFYRAYSPDQWIPSSTNHNQSDSDSSDDEDNAQLETFKNKIWDRLEYNPNGSDNTSNIGRILEVCSRRNGIPISARSDVAYFFVKDNESTDYKVIQTSHPILFNLEVADIHAAAYDDIELKTANHDFL
jgi:hypothetical protein